MGSAAQPPIETEGSDKTNRRTEPRMRTCSEYSERLKQVSMRIAQAAFDFLVVTNWNWHVDWAYGLPLIVLNVVIHVVGLLCGGREWSDLAGGQGRSARRKVHRKTYAMKFMTAALILCLSEPKSSFLMISATFGENRQNQAQHRLVAGAQEAAGLAIPIA
jgi:hypothetical protein